MFAVDLTILAMVLMVLPIFIKNYIYTIKMLLNQWFFSGALNKNNPKALKKSHTSKEVYQYVMLSFD